MPCSGRGKALAEGEKQPWVTLDSNLSTDQCQREALFFGKVTEPGFGVGGDLHVRFTGKAVLDVERSILDCYRGLMIFRTFEGEMKGGVETPRLVRLETKGMKLSSPAIERALKPLATVFTFLFLNFRRATASASEPATT